MKTILVSAYAVNPYEGSESGTGWNFILQIARFHKVIAITRENNGADISKWMKLNPDPIHHNIKFVYYDMPYWMRFWKRKERGAMLYFYLWNLFLPFLAVMGKGLKFDIGHHLNFHNDWSPSFLWLLGRPLVWGPIGHHPKIPVQFLKSRKERWKQELLWLAKRCFWTLDPFLKITKAYAIRILVINSKARGVKKKNVLMPAVSGVLYPFHKKEGICDTRFTILSIGRFVTLKGFDIALQSVALFLQRLSTEDRTKVKFKMVGKGPLKEQLQRSVEGAGLNDVVELIAWMPQAEVMNLYRKAKIFLFPSHEGAGMVVTEALAAGLPVLCFDNCGPGELIDDTSGIRIPYGVPESCAAGFADALYTLFQNPTLQHKLSLGARTRFEQRFDWNQRGLELQQLYKEVLQEEATAPLETEGQWSAADSGT